jgi:ABC-type multidrug transport system ATPase subunit
LTEAIIEAEGVVKRFGKVEAPEGLDLVACSGQVTAVLGPNGAGKTTFVRAVCGAGSTSAQAWSERPACCCSTSRLPG